MLQPVYRQSNLPNLNFPKLFFLRPKMSFNREIENNFRNTYKDHLPSNLTEEIHPSSGSWKKSHSLVLPPLNRYGGLIRTKPSTGNFTNIIATQGELDFQLNSAGFVEKILLEISLSCANAVTLIPHYLIDRIEINATEGNPFSVIYGDNIYLEKVHKSLEQHKREQYFENLDASYNGVALTASTPYIFELHLPNFIDAATPKISAVRDNLKLKIYFSTLGCTSGSPSDITISNCDILQCTQQLSGQLESIEQRRKSSGLHLFRFLNPVRAVSESRAMVASSQYDIRLTSAHGMVAYMLFVVRGSPLSSANINNFLAIDRYELYDSNNTIVGQTITNVLNRHMSLSFDGDIFNYKNIYCLPFAISINSAKNGQSVGSYCFSGDEILRIFTPAGFSSGNYRIDAYTFHYNTLLMNNGRIDVRK